jgi:ferredoxin
LAAGALVLRGGRAASFLRTAPPFVGRSRTAGRATLSPAMAYIITEPCIGTKDKSCVDVCPVDCIHGSDDDKMLFIDPEVCIDCGACVSACPVEAIYADSDVPEQWKNYIEINAEWYKK